MANATTTPADEPCPHCGKTGEMTYNSAANDSYCAECGEWYIENKAIEDTEGELDTDDIDECHCTHCDKDVEVKKGNERCPCGSVGTLKFRE